jgi:hypothetical protein
MFRSVVPLVALVTSALAHQTYEMEADENAKPTFEVSNSRYRFALGFA